MLAQVQNDAGHGPHPAGRVARRWWQRQRPNEPFGRAGWRASPSGQWPAGRRSLVGEDGDYNQDVREQLAEVAKIPALDYLQAQRFRAELTGRMGALLGTVDALPMPAPPAES